MILRRRRRRTDHKTAPHRLCEPAQSKCTWRGHASHFKRKFTGKMPLPRWGPERRRTLCASLCRRNACPDVTRDIRGDTLYGNLQENATAQIRQRTRANTLCEPAQSKCMSTRHKRQQKSHFIPKFTGKMLRPRLGPEHRRTLCASLPSRNTCQDFTRATSYGNLQEKCRGPE